jgi:hypothetical protein
VDVVLRPGLEALEVGQVQLLANLVDRVAPDLDLILGEGAVASIATMSRPATTQSNSTGVPEWGPNPSIGRIMSTTVKSGRTTSPRSIMAFARFVQCMT